MRIIGMDLAVTGAHKAVVMSEQGTYVSPVLSLRTQPEELGRLLKRAREGAKPDEPVSVVMESTGHAWLPVAAYLLERDVRVYVVNTQQVVDLRHFYQKHAKSDRIDARVLAKLALVNPEQLHALRPPSGELLALQRVCKQVRWLTAQETALKNQIVALDRLVWVDGWHSVFPDRPGYHPHPFQNEHFAGLIQTAAAGILPISPPDSGSYHRVFGFIHRLRSRILNAVRLVGERVQQMLKPDTVSLLAGAAKDAVRSKAQPPATAPVPKTLSCGTS